MYRVWLQDMEKAITIFRKVCPHIDMLSSINGNAFGDFVFHIDDDTTYIVKHTDWSVWKRGSKWSEDWVRVFVYNKDEDEDEDDIVECMRQSLGDNWW